MNQPLALRTDMSAPGSTSMAALGEPAQPEQTYQDRLVIDERGHVVWIAPPDLLASIQPVWKVDSKLAARRIPAVTYPDTIGSTQGYMSAPGSTSMAALGEPAQPEQTYQDRLAGSAKHTSTLKRLGEKRRDDYNRSRCGSSHDRTSPHSCHCTVIQYRDNFDRSHRLDDNLATSGKTTRSGAGETRTSPKALLIH